MLKVIVKRGGGYDRNHGANEETAHRILTEQYNFVAVSGTEPPEFVSELEPRDDGAMLAFTAALTVTTKLAASRTETADGATVVSLG